MLAMFDDVQNGEGKFRGGGISTFPHSKCLLLSAFSIKKLSTYNCNVFTNWWFQRSEHCQTSLTCLKRGKGRQSGGGSRSRGLSAVSAADISKRPSFRISIRKNRGHGWTHDTWHHTCLRVTLGPGTRPVSVQDTGMRKVPAAQDSISGSGLSWTHIAVDKNGNNTMWPPNRDTKLILISNCFGLQKLFFKHLPHSATDPRRIVYWLLRTPHLQWQTTHSPLDQSDMGRHGQTCSDVGRRAMFDARCLTWYVFYQTDLK